MKMSWTLPKGKTIALVSLTIRNQTNNDEYRIFTRLLAKFDINYNGDCKESISFVQQPKLISHSDPEISMLTPNISSQTAFVCDLTTPKTAIMSELVITHHALFKMVEKVQTTSWIQLLK